MTQRDMMIAEEMQRMGPPRTLNNIPSPENYPAGGPMVHSAKLPPPEPRELQAIPKPGHAAGFDVPKSWNQPSREGFIQDDVTYGVPIIGGYGGQLNNSRPVHETRPVSKATNGSMQQHPLSISGDNNPLSLNNIPNQARGIL